MADSILITGANRGIGLEMTRQAAAAGHLEAALSDQGQTGVRHRAGHLRVRAGQLVPVQNLLRGLGLARGRWENS